MKQSKMDVLCRKSILSTIYAVFTMFSIAHGQDSLIPPAAVTTVHAGNTAVLTCTLPSSAPSTATVTWSVAVPGSATGKKIVVAPGNIQYNPSNKYSINGTYNLVISNTDAETGTTYTCDPSTVLDLYPAELIVIDSLQAAVSPDGPVTVGTNVTFTCTLSYGAQQQLKQIPTLSLSLGSTGLQGDITYGQPSGTSSYHTLLLVVSHVITESDKGQLWSCQVLSQPSFTMNSELQLLKIDYAPKLINISPRKASYEAGERINCTADGYPPPTVEWKQDGVTQIEATGTGLAVLTVKTPDGAQHWTCNARNRIGTLNQTHSFTVTGSNDGLNNTAPDTSKDNNKAVGIGVGIGIGLGVPIVIAIIILVCVLMRRKGRSREEQITKSPAPPSTESGKPINEAGRPQRPPSNTYNGPGISTNPNPGYKPPVYPEQMSAAPPKTTPDRPGYGDLGVGHIHAGGSTPSLNRSYESSHSRAVRDDDFNHQGPHTSV